MFERATFLILGYYHQEGKTDLLKYEKIANIIKQFKLTCNKYASNIDEICIETPYFCSIITEFTKTENVMMIYKDRNVKAMTEVNVANMGKVFELEKKEFIGPPV